MTTWQQLVYTWRLMWKLGGPLAVFIYRVEGTLHSRIEKAKRELG